MFLTECLRCLSSKATVNKERSTGTITSQDNSGTVGDDEEVIVGFDDVETVTEPSE